MKQTWRPQTHHLDRAQCRDEVHPDDEVKAAHAYDQFRRGDIDGVLLVRMPSGRWAVKRMPKVLED